MSDAQARATNRYRKQNVKSFNVKFFPADADLIEWMDGIEGKNGYIKDLIRQDMERKGVMSEGTYRFESENKGTIEICISGEYADGCKDLTAEICGTGELEEFADLDGGMAEDVFQWLIDRGVEFESDRSLYFNCHYVASVMLDSDSTSTALIKRVAELDDEYVSDWRESTFD